MPPDGGAVRDGEIGASSNSSRSSRRTPHTKPATACIFGRDVFAHYSELSHRDLDELARRRARRKARAKRVPLDFAL